MCCSFLNLETLISGPWMPNLQHLEQDSTGFLHVLLVFYPPICSNGFDKKLKSVWLSGHVTMCPSSLLGVKGRPWAVSRTGSTRREGKESFFEVVAFIFPNRAVNKLQIWPQFILKCGNSSWKETPQTRIREKGTLLRRQDDCFWVRISPFTADDVYFV